MISNIFIDGFALANPGVSYISQVQGLSAPTIDLSTYNRGGRDGVVLGNPYYRQRTLTITLAIVGSTPEDLLANKDRVVTALRLNQYGESRYKQVEFVTSKGERRSCEAIVNKITGELKPETAYACTPLVVQLIANRWYLEGGEHTQEISVPNYGGMSIPTPVPMSMANSPEGGDSQIINAGNTESLPSFRVTGPLSGFDLYNFTTNQRLSVVYTLAAGEYIDLDSYTHAAIVNSVTNVRGSVSGDWLVLAPGANQLSFSATDSQASAQISYKDAYLGI